MKINACIHIDGHLINEIITYIHYTVWCVKKWLLASTCISKCVLTLVDSRDIFAIYS